MAESPQISPSLADPYWRLKRMVLDEGESEQKVSSTLLSIVTAVSFHVRYATLCFVPVRLKPSYRSTTVIKAPLPLRSVKNT